MGDSLRHRARRLPPDHAAGRRGEDLAHRFLRRQGYTIVARNFATRSGAGEIDLIAYDGPTLVFVEVKTRHPNQTAAPASAVDQTKRDRLCRAARQVAGMQGRAFEVTRFDIVSIVLSDPVAIDHLRDAFHPARFPDHSPADRRVAI